MTSASRSSLRVRSASRRRRSGARRAIRNLTLICICIAGTVGSAVIAGGVIGFAKLRGSSASARPLLQLAIAPRLGDAAYVASRRIGRPEQRVIIASLNLPEPRMAPPVLAKAREPDPLFDPRVTGSIGAMAFAPASLRMDAPLTRPAEAAPRIAAPVTVPAAPPSPLPRARPQLASLAPANAPASKLTDETITPKTAIYDITAQAVYLPNGEKLEAHSGLGPYMDDPRHVHLKMRGATPPNVYTLRLREKLFHGVQAIRMTPLDEAAMRGRDGILAHSYLLGPNGQSHGCVSFKDYPRFLNAFMRGEIDRIVVVARLAQPPAFYAKRNMRSASNTHGVQ